MTTLAEYNARALEARIANASLSAELIKSREEIIKLCRDMVQSMNWALDPEESAEGREYQIGRVIDHAHTLLDLAHDFKQAVKR